MEVVSHCPLPVLGRVWKPRPGAFVLTFVCKATFNLAPGKLALAPEHEQLPVDQEDRPWSDTVTSLYAATDLAPRKLRPDVVLIGNAYAPGGTPVQKLSARLSVGEVDKTIEVWCDRTLRADGSVVDGPYVAQVPLLYERAAGGHGTDNPVGMSPERDAYGSVALPNLTPPGTRIGRDAPIQPTGFGPIASWWPARMARLGRYADEFSPDAWFDRPLPPDLDMAYFNVAPSDQHPSVLHNDERIVLENLNAKHPQLTMTLPGLRPQAKVAGPSGERAVVMSCDTLWIDTSREVCCLTYRGQVLVSGPKEAGWVVVTLDEDPDDAPSVRLPSNEGKARTTGMPPRASTLALPFLPGASVPERERPPDREGGLPFLPAASAPDREGGLPFLPAASAPDREGGLPFLPGANAPPDRDSRPGGGLPFQSVGAEALRRTETGLPFRTDGAVPPPRPSSPFGQADSPLKMMPAPTPVWAPPVQPLAMSMPMPPSMPLSQPSMPQPPPPAPVVSSAPIAPPVSDSPWALGPNAPVGAMIAPAAAAPPPAAPAPGDFRAGGAGSLLASNAAAGVNEVRSAIPAPAPSRPQITPAAAPREKPRDPDAIDLLFFDPESVPRMRVVPAWKKLVAELDDKPLDAEEDDPGAVKEPEVVEDRREVMEILVRASPSDAVAVDEAVSRALREDGRFFGPLVLLAGELSTPFDEIEALKATVTTVTPLIGKDENLGASVEVAKDFLKLPGLSSSPAVAEGLTNRVREAWNQGKRAVQPGYLDTQTERALVEQRAYQHRKVLGGKRQRALFHFTPQAGTSQNAQPVVTYLAESVADRLPISARFKVRMIARVHLSLDDYEQGSLALEMLALARLVTPPKRSS